jgi:hypothetical protein
VHGFRDSDLGAATRAVPRERLRREQAFLFAHGRTAVRGQIDLVFRSDDGWVVVDYKASEFEEPDDDYALQMRLYALALEAVTGDVPLRLVLFSLPSARAVDVSCGPDDLAQLRAGLLSEFDRVTF